MITLRFYCIDGGIHPKVGRVFYREAVATGGISEKRYCQYLCEVLNAVAQSADDCDRLLTFINEIETGAETKIETGGNDVAITLDRFGVQVDIEVNEGAGMGSARVCVFLASEPS